MREESDASYHFDPSLDRPARLRYAVAIGSLVLALALRLSLTPILGVQLPTLTFPAAIVVSAWFGGFGPGLLTTALSCVMVLYLFLEPIGRLAISDGASGIGLALFFGFGALTSFLTAALRESERRSRAARLQAEARNAYQASMLSIIHDAVVATDAQGFVTAWNSKAEDIYGWKAEEALGRSVRDVIRSESTDAQRSTTVRSLADTGPYHLEEIQYSRNGRRVWVQRETTALRDEAGRITGHVTANRDITERKQAENKLRRSEAHLAETQKVSHAGSWTWNVSTGDCAWSAEHFRIFGLDPESFKPTVENTRRLIHPEDLPHVEEILETAIRERSGFEVDYRMVSPDGSTRHHHGLGQPVDNESGELEFIGTVVDVTAPRRAEVELRRSKAYLAEAQTLSHTGSWAWNLSTGDTYWSRELFRIFGLVPENATPSYELFFKMLHGDDRSAVRQTFEQAVIETRDCETAYRIVRPDGSVRHIHSISHPAFNEAGELTEYVGTIIDITDRRRAEEELRRSEAYLAEGQRLTHTGSWGWNVITGDIYWSREHYRIFGRDGQRGPPSLEEAFNLVHPDDQAMVQEQFAGVLRGGTDREWDSRVIGSDGAIKFVHTTAHAMTVSGKVTELIGTTMDITERLQAEEERARLLRQVTSSHEEERRRISREIHDELGQQVSALGLKVSAFKQDCANQPALCAEIESIEDVLHQLDSSVDCLVWNVRPTALDDVGLAVALSHAIRHWAKPARAHAQLHTVGMETHRLPADIEVALYRVVQEALNNVVKHADATNVHVFLERRADYVSLIVEDDGKGFDADEVLSDGQGAGLFGIRERAAHVGGTFEVESHRGRGTTLVVQIPLSSISTAGQGDG
jgi:PAS domain S-box-containing protein